MSSSMRSFTLADKSRTRTGCRWFGRFSTYSRSVLRRAFTHSRRFGGFTSRLLPIFKSVRGIVPSLSSGDQTDGFTSRLGGSPTVGLMTGQRSRFVRSPGFLPSSSHSSRGYRHHHHENPKKKRAHLKCRCLFHSAHRHAWNIIFGVRLLLRGGR